MFGRLFELLDQAVERWLSRRESRGNDRQYRQLEIDWHTLEAGGMGEEQ